MASIQTVAELKIAIKELENQQAADWVVLKEQLLTTYEDLSPINMLRGGLKEMVSTPHIKTNLVKVALGLAANLLLNNISLNTNVNPVVKFLANTIQRFMPNIDNVRTEMAIDLQAIKSKINQDNQKNYLT